jgi:hypothetical protein
VVRDVNNARGLVRLGKTAGVARTSTPHRELPDPLAVVLREPYFLLLEAVLVGFLAGFAFALAIATPPSFAYAPGFHAKV